MRLILKTAVLIQSHNNAKYICTLAIKNPQIRFYVHIDQKHQSVFDEIQKKDINNILLLHNRIKVYWGGSSQIYATLNLMKEALKEPRNIYFHLISGECYPLKDFLDIEKEWDTFPEMNYIESNKKIEYNWRLKTLVPHANTNYLRTFLGRVINKILKLFSFFITTSKIDKNYFFFGSQWFSLNRTTINKIIEVHNASSFFFNFKYITCADEHAFQIFVRKYKIQNISNNNKRYIVFKNNSSPIYLTENEIRNLKNSEYWFARKVKCEMAISLLNKKNT